MLRMFLFFFNFFITKKAGYNSVFQNINLNFNQKTISNVKKFDKNEFRIEIKKITDIPICALFAFVFSVVVFYYLNNYYSPFKKINFLIFKILIIPVIFVVFIVLWELFYFFLESFFKKTYRLNILYNKNVELNFLLRKQIKLHLEIICQNQEEEKIEDLLEVLVEEFGFKNKDANTEIHMIFFEIVQNVRNEGKVYCNIDKIANYYSNSLIKHLELPK